MCNSNFTSSESSIFDFSLEARDSPNVDTGYLNFLELYKQVCSARFTHDEKLQEAQRQWAQMNEEQRMQFAPGKSNASLSVKSGSLQGNSNASLSVKSENLQGKSNASLSVKSGNLGQLVEGIAPTSLAFNNYMDEYAIKLTHKAAKKWEAMSKTEQAAYGSKDGVGDSPSDSSDLAMVNDMFGNAGRECNNNNTAMTNCGKPKCQKPKPRCSKPKPKCHKPKPRCRKPKPKCSKPKPKCHKPKPKCHKPKPRCRKPKPKC